jgi:hypothetical protein
MREVSLTKQQPSLSSVIILLATGRGERASFHLDLHVHTYNTGEQAVLDYADCEAVQT